MPTGRSYRVIPDSRVKVGGSCPLINTGAGGLAFLNQLISDVKVDVGFVVALHKLSGSFNVNAGVNTYRILGFAKLTGFKSQLVVIKLKLGFSI